MLNHEVQVCETAVSRIKMAEYLQSNMVQVNTCHSCTILCFHTSAENAFTCFIWQTPTPPLRPLASVPPFCEAFLVRPVESVALPKASALHVALLTTQPGGFISPLLRCRLRLVWPVNKPRMEPTSCRPLSCTAPVLSVNECWRSNCFLYELISRNKKPLIYMFLKFWCHLLAQKLFRYNMVSRHGYTLYFVHLV